MTSNIRFGVVTFFNASVGKKYGFIRVHGQKEEIFFHLNDGMRFCIEGNHVEFNHRSKVSHEPQRGDKVAFVLTTGSKNRPKASPWGFRYGLHEGFEYYLGILATKSTDTPMEPFRQKTGFVCPDWARSFWSLDECTIKPTTDINQHVVLDHSIQTVIFAGTEAECTSFLQGGYIPEARDEPDEYDFVLCDKHGYYWHEDGCLDCAAGE